MQVLVFIEAHGKVKTWSRVLTQLGVASRIVATSGHVSKFPDSLYPVGLGFTKGHAVDVERKPRPDVEARIQSSLRGLPENTKVIIATDDDPEGDVIALDVMKIILDTDPNLIERTLRIRPNALTKDAVRQSLLDSEGDHGGLSDMINRAVYGRARAFTDRWMGATFSRVAETGCGRVRAGILGAAFCWNRSPDLVRDLPETGDLVFQARSSEGGAFFMAHVPLRGPAPEALLSLAARYEGKILPCEVRPHNSVGAAVAPRFGNIAPFNTGDALVYAARHYGVPPKAAMNGLQSAYMSGRLSYPRTDNRSLTQQSMSQILQLSRACGVTDTSMEYAERHRHSDNPNTITSHEALYPIVPMTQGDLDAFKRLVRRPITRVDLNDAAEVEDLMVTLVARRAFEAIRNPEQRPGRFHADPDAPFTQEEREALADLDWVQPISKGLPWGRFQTTGVRYWPIESMIIEGMMIEGIGRPSTYASHADLVMGSGQLEVPTLGAFPRPSQEGQRVLKKLPKGIWVPETCRMIEQSLAEPAPKETTSAGINARMRSRIDAWFYQVSPEIRTSLIKMLKSEGEAPLPSMSLPKVKEVTSHEVASENFYDLHEDHFTELSQPGISM